MVRIGFGALALLLLACSAALADSPPYNAAIERLSVPQSAFVWYPSAAPERPWQAGPWTVTATQGAAPATGQRFPLILFAQGDETPLMHAHLAAALARNGFVVVMPIYTAARHVLLGPRQAEAALAATLEDARLAPILDPARVGMVGHSLGGAVGLILAGGKLDQARYAAYCRTAPADPGACRARAMPGPLPSPIVEHPLKALVLSDPLAAPFDVEGLSAVRMPVLLYRPENSAAALESVLPQSSVLRALPSAEGILLDPCPAGATGCRPSKADWLALRDQVEAEIVAFFRAHL